MSIHQPSTFKLKSINKLGVAEVLTIVAFAFFPLLFNLPYRAYVYLSWEGAYRLSEGQIPFKDFGLPLGGMYWVLPAIFFKIFGVQVVTLVKAQAFLNIIAGLSFRGILKALRVNRYVILPSVVLFCISYSFQNFWPWYNHSVIVYGLVATYFMLKTVTQDAAARNKWLNPLLSGFFIYCSVFTKHDGGALFFVLCNVIMIYNISVTRQWKPWVIFNACFLCLTSFTVLYFSRYEFLYWFNYGQKPHNARLSLGDLIDAFMSASQWLKFYLLVAAFFIALHFKNWKSFINERRYVFFSLLILGILFIAAVIQVTSYIPEFGNFFFHSFAFAFIFDNIYSSVSFKRINQKILLPVLCAGVVLWWSSLPWGYLQRLFIPNEAKGGIQVSPEGENLVGIHNFRFPDGVESVKANAAAAQQNRDTGLGVTEQQNKWVKSSLKTLKHITIPQGTKEGIDYIKGLEIVKQKAGRGLTVLNMTELTFLAAEIPFALEQNPTAPLWHHLGVGMFNKQLHMYENRVKENYYDLVLFEYIPYYNNFFPFEMREYLDKYYQKATSFIAPKSGSKPGLVEVYIRKGE